MNGHERILEPVIERSDVAVSVKYLDLEIVPPEAPKRPEKWETGTAVIGSCEAYFQKAGDFRERWCNRCDLHGHLDAGGFCQEYRKFMG